MIFNIFWKKKILQQNSQKTWINFSHRLSINVRHSYRFVTCFFPGKVDEKATQLHAIASLKVLLDATKPQDNANGGAGGDQAHDSGRASQGTEVRCRHYDH